MKRVILSVVVVFLILAVLAACGGTSGATSPSTVTLAISPASASVITGLTQQFTITVTNSKSCGRST